MKQNELIRLKQRFNELSHQSWGHAVARGADKLWVYGFTPFARALRHESGFDFLGKRYRYFIHQYNATWRNERGVEIAIALDFLATAGAQRVLELGNVLEYYANVNHDVVDKYEQTPDILNIDFINFAPMAPYDAFVSISTVEHIGWDEHPKRPEKVREALAKIASVVTNKDKVLVTFPLGYNSYLDGMVRRGELGFKNSGCLLRVNGRNDWREAPLEEALMLPYGSKFRAANAIFVGIGLN